METIFENMISGFKKFQFLGAKASKRFSYDSTLYLGTRVN